MAAAVAVLLAGGTAFATQVTDTTATEAEEGTASAADQSDSVRAESEGSSGCSTSAPHSFTGSTQVVMADGTAKPIDQIKIGDKIKNAAPGAKSSETHTVDNVIVTTTDHDFVDVTITPVAKHSNSRLMKHVRTAAAAAAIAVTLATPTAANAATAGATVAGAGSGTLTTTYHHPFYDESQAAFVDAQNLDVGDILQTTTGQARAIGLRLYHATQTTYDLTINGLHTYYVIAGTTPVLVHNCNGNVYKAGGKHGPETRGSVRGQNSAEPANGQGALDNSVEYTPEAPGQAPRRLGVSNNQIVVLDRTGQVPCGCGAIEDGVTNIWHGHVRGWDDLSQGMQSVLRKAGLATRKGSLTGTVLDDVVF